MIVDAGNRGAVQLADGQWRRVSWWPHGRGLELAEVSQWNAPPAPAKLQVRRLDGSRIELLGEAGGRTVLRRDEPEFRLVSGGFHWIREVPVM